MISIIATWSGAEESRDGTVLASMSAALDVLGLARGTAELAAAVEAVVEGRQASRRATRGSTRLAIRAGR
jgi:hypothetical protein